MNRPCFLLKFDFFASWIMEIVRSQDIETINKRKSCGMNACISLFIYHKDFPIFPINLFQVDNQAMDTSLGKQHHTLSYNVLLRFHWKVDSFFEYIVPVLLDDSLIKWCPAFMIVVLGSVSNLIRHKYKSAITSTKMIEIVWKVVFRGKN